jgi:radical SAM protein with 4Fe4S-binding SPASM domain
MPTGAPKRIEGLVVKNEGGTLALSNPIDGSILLTNRVGGKILDLIDGTRGFDAICDALASEFQHTERSKLRDHVAIFLENGEKKGILTYVGVPASGTAVQVRQRSGLTVLPATDAGRQQAAESTLEQERKFHPDVYWYLTFRCNLACAHCSVLSSPTVDNSNDLKTDDCLQVVEQLAEMNVAMAMLSGGEVLIRPDAVTIIRTLADKGIYVGVETNGLKFDRPFIELAKELQERRLINITVSLDGGTAETHSVLRGPKSFERTVRGLRLLHENGIHFDIQCVLNRENYHTIPDLYDLALEIEPQRLLWSPLNASGRGSELVQRIGLRYEETVALLELIDQHKQRFPGINLIKMPPAMVPPRYLLQVYKGQDVGCSTSCKFPLLGVLPNGDITVCAVSRDDNSLYFGNVKTTRLKAAWEKARMDLLRSRYVGAEDLQGICGDCVWKHSCKGSCRAMAYEEGEDFFSPFPVCQEAADRGVFPDVYRISKGGRSVSHAHLTEFQI